MEVRRADDTDLARIDEFPERFERGVLRGRLVVLMREIEIDPVGAEALERRVTGRGDPRGGELFAAITGQHPDLRREEHGVALAARLQPFADHRLGLAALVAGNPGGIDVGRVDHRAAASDERVEDGEAGVAIGGPAEDVAAEHQRRDLQVGSAEAP